MIDLKTHLAAIEALMAMMQKHDIEELSCDFLRLKRHISPKLKQDINIDKLLLDKHLAPIDEEPWMSISDDQIDAFAKTGKV